MSPVIITLLTRYRGIPKPQLYPRLNVDHIYKHCTANALHFSWVKKVGSTFIMHPIGPSIFYPFYSTPSILPNLSVLSAWTPFFCVSPKLLACFDKPEHSLLFHFLHWLYLSSTTTPSDTQFGSRFGLFGSSLLLCPPLYLFLSNVTTPRRRDRLQHRCQC